MLCVVAGSRRHGWWGVKDEACDGCRTIFLRCEMCVQPLEDYPWHEALAVQVLLGHVYCSKVLQRLAPIGCSEGTFSERTNSLRPFRMKLLVLLLSSLCHH